MSNYIPLTPIDVIMYMSHILMLKYIEAETVATEDCGTIGLQIGVLVAWDKHQCVELSTGIVFDFIRDLSSVPRAWRVQTACVAAVHCRLGRTEYSSKQWIYYTDKVNLFQLCFVCFVILIIRWELSIFCVFCRYCDQSLWLSHFYLFHFRWQ